CELRASPVSPFQTLVPVPPRVAPPSSGRMKKNWKICEVPWKTVRWMNTSKSSKSARKNRLMALPMKQAKMSPKNQELTHHSDPQPPAHYPFIFSSIHCASPPVYKI